MRLLLLFAIFSIGACIFHSCGKDDAFDNDAILNNKTDDKKKNLIEAPWKDDDTYEPDPFWNNDQYLTNNISQKFAGIYAFENLTIGDNVSIYSSGISELVFKVKGTLTIGKNVKIIVRNGYYKESPEVAISSLNSDNLKQIGENVRNVYLFPGTFGKGGDGGDGERGNTGKVTTIYIGFGEYYTIYGVGGSGGGGGGGGFGGGKEGSGGAEGAGAGGFGYVGNNGHPNGANGGHGGANPSIGIGGGATGLGTRALMSNDMIGAGGGGGGGNGGHGADGDSSNLYRGGGGGFGGEGGGGGGYGGGILYIAAKNIVYNDTSPPLFGVSGQLGGHGFQSGKQGEGGLLIVYSETTNLPASIWELSTVLRNQSLNGGHGWIYGNPQAVYINGTRR
jgi:hypothetical protein